MNNDGTGVRQLTNNSAEDVGADWSPDGGRIAFTSNRSGNYHIYSIDTSGTDIRQITHLAGNNIQPDWKPIDSVNSSTSEGNGAAIFPECPIAPNFPNPFNESTTITYQLPEDSYIELHITDLIGREQSCLVNQYQTAGEYSISWDASNFSSGLYLILMRTADQFSVRKCMLLK